MRREGSGTQGLAALAPRLVSERARQISTSIEGREPQEVLEDVRSFARRRPGTFLLGALAAGVLAGRLLRGAKDANGTPDLQQTPAGPAYDPLQADVVAPSTVTVVDEPIAPVAGTTTAGADIGSGLGSSTESGVHRGTP